MQQSVAPHYGHHGAPQYHATAQQPLNHHPQQALPPQQQQQYLAQPQYSAAMNPQQLPVAGQEVVYDTTCYQQQERSALQANTMQQQQHQQQQPYQKCEVSVTSARASVLVYNEQSKKWVPSGTSSGLSKVHIYQHTLNGTFRIVGRKLDDHEVVINSAILKGFKYNQATATFHQWRDQRAIYGLNFSSKDDAEHFAHAMTTALEQLSNPNAAPPLPPPQPSQSTPPAPIYQTPVEVPQAPQPSQQPAYHPPLTNGAPPPPPPPMPIGGQHQRNPSTNGNLYGSAPTVPPMAPPPAPPAPPAAACNAPPAPPPPGPPISTGAPPPPPPPPPPCGGSTGGDGNSLLAALSSVKLKKTSPSSDNSGGHDNSHLRKQSTGNPMASMLDEMQGTLAKRRAQAEKKSAVTALFQDGKDKDDHLGSNGSSCKTWSAGQNGVVKRNDQGDLSPKSQRKQRMGSIGDMDGFKLNGDSNGASLDNEQIERLKNEILIEMKKHINKAKDEIITAIRQELNRR